MRTVIFDLFAPTELKASMKRAVETGVPDVPRISFVSTEDMLKALGGRRTEMLKALAGAGPVGIRELARRLDRDARAVHADAHTLIEFGVLDKHDDGKVEFPYDAVHVDFMVFAA